MTEADWASCDEPRVMLRAAGGATSARKLRLFNTACCRRVWHLLGDARSRAAVEAAERFADGQLDIASLQAAADAAERAAEDLQPPRESTAGWGLSRSVRGSATDPAKEARAAWLAAWEGSRSPFFKPGDPLLAVIDAADDCVSAAGWHATTGEDRSEARRDAVRRANEARNAERRAQAELIRDIVGNPFRTTVLDPAWRTEPVIGLAGGMYESRDFNSMPVLADALENAGCDLSDIMDHCRSDLRHARGCWVLDLALGMD